MSEYKTDNYNPLIDDPGFEMDIITAASMGDFRRVQLLLKDGADASAVNSSGWTPLMYAAHYGHIGVVRVLLEAGCDVDQREWKDQRTALMLAASNGHTKCLDLLISCGSADIHAADSSGKTAAYHAAAHGHGGNSIIRELLQITSPRPGSKSPVPPVVVTTATTPQKGDTAGEQEKRGDRMFVRSGGSSDRGSRASSPFLMIGSRTHGEPFSPKKYRPSPVRDRDLACRKKIDFAPHATSSETDKPLPESLSELLHRLGLSEYEAVFAENGIDLFTFPDLSEKELIRIGIGKLGHRKRLLAAQLRLVESVEIRSVHEAIFADYLLHERQRLQQENDGLRSHIMQWRDYVNQVLDYVTHLFEQKAAPQPEEPVIDVPEYRSL